MVFASGVIWPLLFADHRYQHGQHELEHVGKMVSPMPGWLIAILLAAHLFCFPAMAENRFPGAEWTYMTPTAAGWSESGLAKAHDWSQHIHSTAVMVIQHGSVMAEWGDTAKRTELASVRKSLLSALIGIAVAQKEINLDNTLGQLGIDDNTPSLTDIEKRATVRMLLEARSGIYHPALYETRSMAAKRPLRGSHAPGSFWYYNNWDFNTLGTIYEHSTGVGIYDALEQQIAKPLGMQDYRPEDGHYVTGSASIQRAYPLRMSARDLARFALLYLHNGMWAGRQVVPSEWVNESTRAYSHTDVGPGYGYLWWTEKGNEPADIGIRPPDGSFLAWGAGGQFAFIIPAHDLVVVNRVDPDQTKFEVTLPMVSYLLNLILEAGGYQPTL